MIRLSERARRLLPEGDVLVFDWHPIAFCCASAGEVVLRRSSRRSLGARFRALPADPPGSAFAAPFAYPHLVSRDVGVDGRRRLGVRAFSSDLPADFGLRVCFGRDLSSDVVEGAP